MRQLIGLTGQYASVDEMLTGTENLVMIGRLLDLPRREAKARAAELLERFDLGDAARPGGQDLLRRDAPPARPRRQPRRAARRSSSSTSRPPGWTRQAATTLWDIVRGLVADGVTVLLTTQYLEEADQLADDIAVIDHGRVIAHGTPDRAEEPVVGGQVLQVRPSTSATARPSPALVSMVAGDGTDRPGRPGHRAGRRPRRAAEVVRHLDDAGVLVAELTLRRSSLDEVFLSLTGHRAEEPVLGDRG